ncbi:MAG: hypothetical protein U0527_03185 [Candidatus Eisenbacteria bacterium]
MMPRWTFALPLIAVTLCGSQVNATTPIAPSAEPKVEAQATPQTASTESGPAETVVTEPLPSPPATPAVPPRARTGIYLHVGGGSGMGVMTSDGITSLFGDGIGIGVGFHFSYSFTGGFRNIAQVELRRGDSSHDIHGAGVFGQTPAVQIPMDYDFAEYVAKLNLLSVSPANLRGRTSALFVLAGTADVSYLDKQDDGFEGSGKVLGMEYTRFSPNGGATISLGVRRYDIQFDQITLLGHTIPYNVDASNWVLHTAMTFGFAF